MNNRYQLHEQLGSGGMGAVFRATDRLTGEHVALKKVLTPPTQLHFNSRNDSNTSARLALIREFQTLASLRHPHIISVLDYGLDDHPYFTMTLLHAPQTILNASYAQPFERKIELLMQLLEALTYLHQRGVVHRDLKPDNVLVESNLLKVVDFGLAVQPNQTHGLGGTLPYMAPEVIQGHPFTPQADLYAVGVIAHQLIVGKHPFDLTAKLNDLILQIIGDSPKIEALYAALDKTLPLIPPDLAPTVPLMPPQTPAVEMPSLPDADNSIAMFILRLLAKQPHERYPSARAALEVLQQILQQPSTTDSPAIRESFLQAAAFVGRESEVAQLDHALTQMTSTGGLWLVGGESGVGKSRLLDEFRIRALVNGAVVVRGQAVRDGAQPFQIWQEVLRRLILEVPIDPITAGILKPLLPDIDSFTAVIDSVELEPRQANQRFLTAVTSLFQSLTHPFVILLEDLQWAGSESLELLKKLTNIPCLLIIGSYRLEERPALPDELPNANLLKLERLSDQAIATLTASMLGNPQADVVELVQRESEGNVFFVVEVVRALAEEAGKLTEVGRKTLPDKVFAGGVAATIQRRLNLVPEVARPLLDLAGILGRQLDLPVLQAAFPTADCQIWLQLCANVAVLEVQDNQWRFAHDKLREGVLNALPSALQPALHQKAATALEAVHPNQTAPLAYHWGKAANTTKEWFYLKSVIFNLIDLGIFREALPHIERGLTIAPDHDQPHLKRQLALAYTGLGRREEAKAVLDDLYQFYMLIDLPHEQAGILNIMGELARVGGDIVTSQERYASALRIAIALDDWRQVRVAHKGLGNLAYMAGKYTEAKQHYEDGLATMGSENELGSRAALLNNLGLIVMSEGDYARTQTIYDECVQIYERTGELSGLAHTLMNLGLVAFMQKDYDTARHFYHRALEVYTRIGQAWGKAATLLNTAELEESLGNYAQAQKLARQSLQGFQQVGDRRAVAINYNSLGNLSLRLNEDSNAADYLKNAAQTAYAVQAIPVLLSAFVQYAEFLIRQGEKESALHLLGFALAHEAIEPWVKEKGEGLCNPLQTEPFYQTALDHGKHWSLDKAFSLLS